MIKTHWHLIHKADSPSGLVSFVTFQVQDTLPFLEGQFVMIEAQIQGKKIKKPYSIATTNKQMQESKQIWFVVKKVSEAGMSHFLTQDIHMGDEIALTWPVWHYTDSQTHKNYLFISTWSGLSPNVWLFQHLVYESWAYTDIVQVFGEKTQADIVPEIHNIFTTHWQKNVTNFFHLSREAKSPPLIRGGAIGGGVSNPTWNIRKPWYVQSSIPAALEILGTETSCFICGKPEMVDEVRALLQEAGIEKEDITFEKY